MRLHKLPFKLDMKCKPSIVILYVLNIYISRVVVTKAFPFVGSSACTSSVPTAEEPRSCFVMFGSQISSGMLSHPALLVPSATSTGTQSL